MVNCLSLPPATIGGEYGDITPLVISLVSANTTLNISYPGAGGTAKVLINETASRIFSFFHILAAPVFPTTAEQGTV